MKNIIVFLLAALLGVAAGLICSTAFAVTTVSDDAMVPALIKGDHVLLDLFADGKKDMNRGDVVALENPLYGKTGEGSRMLKRIVGLPGEVVEISDGLIWIDGLPLTDDAFVPCLCGPLHLYVEAPPPPQPWLLVTQPQSSLLTFSVTHTVDIALNAFFYSWP